MAKRPPRPAKTDSPVVNPSPGNAGNVASDANRRPRPGQTGSAAPLRRSTYVDAVALYERGLEALGRHDYQDAKNLLESVLRQFPEEKELHEGVRLYLSICVRQSVHQEAAPRTIDERLYAATIAINGGHYDQALVHLRLVRDEDPNNDHALYMLAVAHAQRFEHAEAVAHLERAIALNPENRGRARMDPDLDPIRGDETLRGALDSQRPRAPELPGPRRPLGARTGR